MGFLPECINDQEAVFMLFDRCRSWLEERGMKSSRRPVNFESVTSGEGAGVVICCWRSTAYSKSGHSRHK